MTAFEYFQGGGYLANILVQEGPKKGAGLWAFYNLNRALILHLVFWVTKGIAPYIRKKIKT